MLYKYKLTSGYKPHCSLLFRTILFKRNLFIRHLSSNSDVKPVAAKSPKLDLSFTNAKEAYRSKTTSELIRALLVFTLCSSNFLIDNNKRLIEWSRKFLGRTLFRKLQFATFYGHFVAGEDQESIKPIISKNRQFGVKSILDYSVEQDVSESEAIEIVKDGLREVMEDSESALERGGHFQTSLEFAQRSKMVESARTYYYKGEKQCDQHMETFFRCIDAVADATKAEGLAAIKLTALGRPQLLLHLSDVIVQIRNMYEMLCDDIPTPESLGRIDRRHFHKRLETLGLKIDNESESAWFTILDVSKDTHIDLLDWQNLLDVKIDLAKAFRVRDISSNEERQLIPSLSSEGVFELRNMLARVNRVVEHAKKANVRVMVDAEQTYLQPAIRRITMEMMRVYNKNSAVIFNTYQCYLLSALENITVDLSLSERDNFYFGAKIVRGAYLEQERARAAELGYENLMCESYEDTTKNYNLVLDKIFETIKKRPIGYVSAMVASHNEDTVRYALQQMENNGIKQSDRLICFAQLLGMCDHVSFPLGQAGYSVYKYLPYGPVEEVLPYLSRRAFENRGVLAKVKKEKRMLREEIRRRLLRL